MRDIKIFQMSECDWVAAETFQDALQCLADTLTNGDLMAVIEYVDNPKILNKEDMIKMRFRDDYENYKSRHRSFKKELQNRIKRQEKFPQMFAFGD